MIEKHYVHWEEVVFFTECKESTQYMVWYHNKSLGYILDSVTWNQGIKGSIYIIETLLCQNNTKVVSVIQNCICIVNYTSCLKCKI